MKRFPWDTPGARAREWLAGAFMIVGIAFMVYVVVCVVNVLTG